MTAPAAAAPRSAGRIATATAVAVMVYVHLWGLARVLLTGAEPEAIAGLVLLCASFGVGVIGRARPSLPHAAAVAVVAVVGLGLAMGSLRAAPTGADTWCTSAVACVALLLIWRRRSLVAWLLMLAMLVVVGAMDGVEALNELGLFVTVLFLGVIAAGGHALDWYDVQMIRYAESEHEAMDRRISQDVYQVSHQQRIDQTGRLAERMLTTVVQRGGRLEQAERVECRLLHQTIRDETRGRHLLNDAMREQILVHRRRGANVQVLDDGRLDDIDPAALSDLLDEAAARIAPLRSDRIVIRSAASPSPTAVTVVATTSDPIAAALGSDEDETLDLWLELPRPEGALPSRS